MSQERKPRAFGPNLLVKPIVPPAETLEKHGLLLTPESASTIFNYESSIVVSVGNGYGSSGIPLQPGDIVIHSRNARKALNYVGSVETFYSLPIISVEAYERAEP